MSHENVTWHKACKTHDVEEDDVIQVIINGKDYAIYYLKDEGYFATDGLCTHEQAPLAEGLVMDGIIECPKHNARFDIKTGKVLSRPARADLNTYPIKIEDSVVLIGITLEP